MKLRSFYTLHACMTSMLTFWSVRTWEWGYNKVWKGCQTVRWKSSRKWTRFWTPYTNVSLWPFLETPILCFTSCCSLALIDFTTNFTSILILCLRFPFYVSLLAFSSLLSFWRHYNETTITLQCWEQWTCVNVHKFLWTGSPTCSDGFAILLLDLLFCQL